MLPGGETGRSVIGRTDIDGNGIAGLELQYGATCSRRATRPGGARATRGGPGGSLDPRQRAGHQQPVPGDDIILTLDRSVQFAVEQALLGRVGELGAKWRPVVVMDTETGDVLAMASVAHQRRRASYEITSGNFAAVDAYEPGSVGKVITIAGAPQPGNGDARHHVLGAVAQAVTRTTTA